MTRFHTSKPDAWVSPRPACDASQRLTTYGPIVSMDEARREAWRRDRWLLPACVVLFLGAMFAGIAGGWL